MKQRAVYAPIQYYLLLTILPQGGSAYTCNDNRSSLVDDMCVLYDATPLTDWFGAKKKCAKYGMHLAIVQSTQQILKMISLVPPNEEPNIWIGGNDLDNEGRFIWDEDQRPIVENVWRKNEPNNVNGNEDCTFINHARLINDDLCDHEKKALCMYRLPTPKNLFGPNNSFICRCADGACLSDGTCNGSKVLCAKGWFGPSCQFRSISGDNYGPLGVLADNDDTTCTSNITKPITVKLKTGSLFTEMRIVVEKPEHLGGFEIYSNAFGVRVVCQPLRVLYVDERSVDIFCSEKPLVVDEVVISWSGKKNVCSVYIKGDQNFALLENTSLGKDAGSDNSSSLPLDGRRSPADQCFTGLPKVGRQQWTMTLKKPKVINEIIIYRRPRIQGYAFMNNFYIRGFDENGDMMFHYNDTGMNAYKSTVELITEVNVPMHKIDIGLDNANETHYLELCEVETFGACGPPDYGVFCDKTCDIRCRGQKCHFSGKCMKCAYGQSGDGECLSAEEAAATTSPPAITSSSIRGITARPTEVNGTMETVTGRTTKTRTVSPLLQCTTPIGRAAENNRLLKNLVLANLLLALLVALLIIFIVYTKKESTGFHFQELATDRKDEDSDLGEQSREMSEQTEQTEQTGYPDISASRTSRSTKTEKSQITLKRFRSSSSHIT